MVGGYSGLSDAVSSLGGDGRMVTHPLTECCGAIVVGVIDGTPMLDLPYGEDVRAGVDRNVVMTSLGGFVEVQGTAEGAPFSRPELDSLLGLAEKGIGEIIELQRATVAEPPAPRA